MSPARHTTHNPRHGLGSRLGWREISTGGTTPTPDSARPESGARADWQACTTHVFLLDHRTSCTVFRAMVVFAMTTIADDGVDAETSLSFFLSLFMSTSLLRLFFSRSLLGQ